jgi:membrane protein YdbS with pleckstrin-like domain
MKCSACQAETPDDADFCAKCGHNLKNEANDTAPQAEAASQTPIERFKNAVASTRDDDDEEEITLWIGGYSAKAMVGSWMLAAMASVLFVVAAIYFQFSLLIAFVLICLTWIFVALVLVYRKMGVYYELTTQRFIHKSGILKRTSDRLEVIDIDDVTFSQGLIQRIVNVGTIRISSSDRTHPELMLIGIENVHEVADNIDDVRRIERRRRGLHIEAI